MDYPRVTEILKPYTSYDQVPKDILKKAAERGTSVHAICASLAKGAWIPDGMINEEFLPYVNSFKQWAEQQVDLFVFIEKRYQDHHLEYTGQIDFVIQGKDEKLYLVDLKTSAAPQKTYPIQMAAYNNLLDGENVKVHGAMIVYLSKLGEFPEIDFIENLYEQFEIFKCALNCYNYFKRKKHGRKAA